VKRVIMCAGALLLIVLPSARGQTRGVTAVPVDKQQLAVVPGTNHAAIERKKDTVCFAYDKYFVIQANHGDVVRTHIVVKRKMAKDAIFPCEYDANPGDYEVKSGDLGDYSFLGILGDLMFIEDRSRENRRLYIFDLARRMRVFDASYFHEPAELVDPNHLAFWQTAGDATRKQCPDDYEELHEHGMGPTIEQRVVLELHTFFEDRTHDTRCGFTQ
jgi:hypothetical protein